MQWRARPRNTCCVSSSLDSHALFHMSHTSRSVGGARTRSHQLLHLRLVHGGRCARRVDAGTVAWRTSGGKEATRHAKIEREEMSTKTKRKKGEEKKKKCLFNETMPPPSVRLYLHHCRHARRRRRRRHRPS